MKRWQYIAAGIILVLVILQFIPSDLPPNNNDTGGDLINSGLVDADVAGILKTSCYNCHSNTTQYPWYSNVAPVSWLVERDVKEGREELNFSLWSSYDLEEKLSKLDDIAEEVGEGKMPMQIYTIMHPSANLDKLQRERIIAWAEATMDKVAEEAPEEE